MLGIFHGFVQADGKLQFDDPHAVVRYIGSLRGRRLDISIEIHRKGRSQKQNKLLHAICRAIGEHLGYEEEEVWELMKQRFLLIERDGRTFCRSTSTLNTKEMAELTEKVLRWAATEFGCVFFTRDEQVQMRSQGMAV